MSTNEFHLEGKSTAITISLSWLRRWYKGYEWYKTPKYKLIAYTSVIPECLMNEALQIAGILAKWIAKHELCFTMLLVHIEDEESRREN